MVWALIVLLLLVYPKLCIIERSMDEESGDLVLVWDLAILSCVSSGKWVNFSGKWKGGILVCLSCILNSFNRFSLNALWLLRTMLGTGDVVNKTGVAPAILNLRVLLSFQPAFLITDIFSDVGSSGQCSF